MGFGRLLMVGSRSGSSKVSSGVGEQGEVGMWASEHCHLVECGHEGNMVG